MNTGGPASEKTLLDELAGQALAGLCSSWYDRHKDDPETQRGHGPTLISQSAYTHAEAMLAEKARREADAHPATSLDVVARERDQAIDRMANLEALNGQLVEALEALLARDQRNTCQHEETHRGGALWEICDQCGASWADDEGGKPPWSDPPEWIAAAAVLAKAKGKT